MFDEKKIISAAALLNTSPIDFEAIENAVEATMRALGEDPTREGLQRTPQRVSHAYEELLAGYRTDPIALLNNAVFEEDYDSMVVVRDIEYYSLCEHHMLPFIGHAHVAYIPSGKVIGLSKIPRIVDMFARRLQVQERLTRQIADFLHEVLRPQGVAVVVEGLHMCSMTRGVMKNDARMTTSAMLGAFRRSAVTRQEFLDNISRNIASLKI